MIEYNGELSGQAITLLVAMCAILIGGFSWCFYRAIRTIGTAGDEEQHPDEI